MKAQDRKNLINGWPVYLLFIVLAAGMVALYHQRLSKHGNEPLPKLITQNLEETKHTYQNLDDVINSRRTWEPVLPDWQGKILPNLTFTSINGDKKQLTDYEGRQIILVIGATWYAPFKLQLNVLQEVINKLKDENLTLIAVTAESVETMKTFMDENPYNFEAGSVEELSKPYSLPDGFPCIFFINTERQLKLAIVGLIPSSQVQAVVRLPVQEH